MCTIFFTNFALYFVADVCGSFESPIVISDDALDGQLYVVISRVTSREGLKILVCKDEEDESNGDSTVNIVYKEVF